MSGRVTSPAAGPAARGAPAGALWAPRGARRPRRGPAPAPERIPRVARVLALAHHWQGLIRSGAVRDQADLARLVGVSRARVAQVMSLLWLAPDIQEVVLAGKVRRPQPERALRTLASEPAWSRQVEFLDEHTKGVAGSNLGAHVGEGRACTDVQRWPRLRSDPAYPILIF